MGQIVFALGRTPGWRVGDASDWERGTGTGDGDSGDSGGDGALGPRYGSMAD